jgi:hypothetical protein
MNAKHLLNFIVKKLETEGETKVYKKKDNTIATLKDLFADIGIKPTDLCLNTLDV